MHNNLLSGQREIEKENSKSRERIGQDELIRWTARDTKKISFKLRCPMEKTVVYEIKGTCKKSVSIN